MTHAVFRTSVETPTMNDEQSTQTTPNPQLDLRHLREVLKASYADALHVVRNAREVTGRPRQVQLGALLGICVAFLVGLMGAQHLDAPLTFASRAFGAALPFLVMDFIVASHDLRPEKSAFLVNVLKFAAFVTCEALGTLGVAIGIGAVLLHFSGTALILTILAAGMALLMPGIVLLAIILWLIVLNAKAQRAGVELEIEDLAPKSRFLSLFVPLITTSPASAQPAETPVTTQVDTTLQHVEGAEDVTGAPSSAAHAQENGARELTPPLPRRRGRSGLPG